MIPTALTARARRKDRDLALLHRMWGVREHLEEMLACMLSCDLHGGAMAVAAKAYTDAPDKTASAKGRIVRAISSIRLVLGWLVLLKTQMPCAARRNYPAGEAEKWLRSESFGKVCAGLAPCIEPPVVAGSV